MEDNINLLESQYSDYKENIAKFNEKENAAAGTRARKALLEIAKLTKVIRKEIQDIKNSNK
jgi:vacuolar-type H+-ATPase catalytic subunit A/Vma1